MALTPAEKQQRHRYTLRVQGRYEPVLEKGRRYHKRKREEAMLMIANFRGGMRCHYELTPYLPTFEESCEGKLEIDHINGGGTEDFEEKSPYHVYREIRLGERNLNEFRLLCAKHNQWFQHARVQDYRELHELRNKPSNSDVALEIT